MDSVKRKSLTKGFFIGAVLAIIKQHKADRDNGKVLCPKMDKIVNIYSQVLKDHPEPVKRGTAK